MKSHISPDGPGRCKATVGTCPYGGDDNHFNTIAEARKEHASRMESAYTNLESERKRVHRLNEVEKSLLEKNAKLAQKIVEMRAQQTDGIVYEDANAERAQRRLNEAIEYGKSRQNTFLVDKLSSARVLPSGAFKTEDGQRVNTDSALKTYVAEKKIDEGRKKLISAIQDKINAGGLTSDKYSFKDESGSYSLTIKPSFDQDEFDKLPEKLKNSISSEQDKISSELAKNKLSKEQFEEISTQSQVLDFVVGKEPDIGQNTVKINTEITSSGDAAMNDGLKNMANFYGQTSEVYGKPAELKKKKAEDGAAIKSTAAKHDGHTFAPARSQSNGALITTRRSISSKLASEKLSSSDLASITEKVSAPDTEKARSVLSKDAYAKIFEKPTASVRVTLAK